MNEAVDFEIGDETNSRLFEFVDILATDRVRLKSKYDATGYGEVFSYSDSTETNVRLNAFSPNGTYSAFIAVEASNTYTRIRMGGSVGIGLTPTANMTGIALEGGALTIKEITTPTADTNYGKVYTKDDNKLYFQDGAGGEHEVTLAT